MTDAKTSSALTISDNSPASEPTPFSELLTADAIPSFPTPIPLSTLPPDAELIPLLPFYATIRTITAYPELEALHYGLIDVENDGHCGIYSIMVGLIAKGIITHPYPSIFEIRNRLRNTVRDHVKALCAPDTDGKLQDGMIQFITDEEGWNEALISLYDDDLSPRSYVNIRQSPQHHTMAHWLPLAAALLYRMPIIQHVRYSTPRRVIWSTSFYDGTTYDPDKPSIKIVHCPTLTRMDIDSRQPPLEIFFQSSTPELNVAEDDHVMVLRRLPNNKVFEPPCKKVRHS